MRCRDGRKSVRARVAWDYHAQKNDEITIERDTIVVGWQPFCVCVCV